jgi:hypothetical protein
MISISRAFAVLVLVSSILPTARGAEPRTLAQQYSALLKEYRPISGGTRNAKTDAERKLVVERMAAFAPKFVELAAKYPDDPIAITALRQAIQAVVSADSAAQIVWQTNKSEFPRGMSNATAENTVNQLIRDHLTSDKLAMVCDRARYGYRMEYGRFLEAVLEKNPHRPVQAVACLSLGQFYNDRLRMLQLAEDRPELAERYAAVLGKNYLPGLKKIGKAGLASRAEELFERAVKDYADVKFRTGTIGDKAALELFDIRHLAIGKVAPDTVGKDQDGKDLKLSDYRGKVVLLYFWMEF